MEITPGQRLALENLARKASGEDVGWINIADAGALAEMGLCKRDRQGWHISPQGLAWLTGAEPPPASTVSNIIQLKP